MVVVLRCVNLQGLVARIKDPIFLHPDSEVFLLLCIAINEAIAWRNDLHDNIRCAFYTSLRNEFKVFWANEDYIGLKNCTLINKKINRSKIKPLPLTLLLIGR